MSLFCRADSAGASRKHERSRGREEAVSMEEDVGMSSIGPTWCTTATGDRMRLTWTGMGTGCGMSLFCRADKSAGASWKHERSRGREGAGSMEGDVGMSAVVQVSRHSKRHN